MGPRPSEDKPGKEAEAGDSQSSRRWKPTPPGWVGGREHRVLRGGGWRIGSYMPQDLYVTDLRVDFRMPYNAAVDDCNIGCRCAADVPPDS